MTHGSLFSGIGGFDLAAEWMGWQNVFHCEWNDFGQRVLKHYWPDAISYHDICKTDFTKHYGTVDIISGGFPCQPYSTAGKRLGKADDRHLWPEMLRAIREIAPTWVVGENVRGLVNWNGGMVFDEVQADLEACGYEVQPFLLPACAVNAPHRRDRIWFVAHAKGNGNRGKLRRLESENEGKWKSEECGQDNCEHWNYGCQRPTPDTDCNGHQSGRFGQNRPTPNTSQTDQQERQRIWHNHRRTGKSGPTPDTNILRNTSCGEGKEIEGVGCGNNGEQKTWGEQTERPNGLFGLQPNAADTDNQGCQRNRTQPLAEKQIQISTGHSNHVRANAWQDFPTQSPVCSGDDGISARLDGITFPKWRNESIKAAGNAIVPHVAYQIFKAIQAYENTTI